MNKSPINDHYWEVRQNGVIVAHGTKSTMPLLAERQSMRSAGMKIYIEGKIFREVKSVK